VKHDLSGQINHPPIPAEFDQSQMETLMSRRIIVWGQFAAIGVVSLLGACAQTPQPQTAAVTAPVWYHVSFESNSFAIGPNGQQAVADLSAYLQHNPTAVATIVGRTDTVGSADYNMHLSHQRADAVRDAVVYGNKIAEDRVETRWSGEKHLDNTTGNDVASAQNRVVDIAVH
jgi:outer membrane protein OmpA-like peptidoglycan-associated protein